MWYSGWQQIGPEYTRSKKPTQDKVDWAAAAQQWMKNKEMYETWQQQHYQQMQMMQQQQSTSNIDPSVIANPPPPPPPPPSSSFEDMTEAAATTSNSQVGDSSNSDDSNKNSTEVQLPPPPPVPMIPAPPPLPPTTATPAAIPTPLLPIPPVATAAVPIPGQSPLTTPPMVPNQMWNGYDAWSSWPGYTWPHQTITQTMAPIAPVKQETPPQTKASITQSQLLEDKEKLQAKIQQLLNEADSDSNSKSDVNSPTEASGKSHKQLPLWIRDGLANIEKEKQQKKQLDKFTKVKALLGADEDDDDEMEYSNSPKSNFEEKQLPISKKPLLKSKPETANVESIKLTEEEKQEINVQLMKTWMTEILLDVTNSEMRLVANEVFKKAAAQAKPIAKTSALNMITNELGDSDSDNETSDDEDVDVLKKRAEQKFKEYEKKFYEEYAPQSNQNSPALKSNNSNLDQLIKHEESILNSTNSDTSKALNGSKSDIQTSKKERKSRSRSRTRSKSRSRSRDGDSSKKRRKKRRDSRSRSSSSSRRNYRRRRSSSPRSRSRSSSRHKHSSRKTNSGRSNRRTRSRSRSTSKSKSSRKHAKARRRSSHSRSSSRSRSPSYHKSSTSKKSKHKNKSRSRS